MEDELHTFVPEDIELVMKHRCRKRRVTVNRWDVYRAEVEASTGADAEERALEMYQETEDYEHVDGGADSVWAEEVKE